MMKLAACLFLSAAALAQQPNGGKTITFNRADTEHCRVVVASGKPLLESTFNGISVAVGLPVNRGNGNFAVFVAVGRVDGDPVQVNPKDFYALYSDPDHTRFEFYDQSAEMKGSDNGMSATSAQVDPGSLRPGAVHGGPPPGGGSIGSDSPPDSKGAASGPSMPAAYFHGGKIKQGDKIVGWVVLQQPKGSKLTISPTDMLAEINIVVEGTAFRF
jgi:hypothetical protein